MKGERWEGPRVNWSTGSPALDGSERPFHFRLPWLLPDCHFRFSFPLPPRRRPAGALLCPHVGALSLFRVLRPLPWHTGNAEDGGSAGYVFPGEEENCAIEGWGAALLRVAQFILRSFPLLGKRTTPRIQRAHGCCSASWGSKVERRDRLPGGSG